MPPQPVPPQMHAAGERSVPRRQLVVDFFLCVAAAGNFACKPTIFSRAMAAPPTAAESPLPPAAECCPDAPEEASDAPPLLGDEDDLAEQAPALSPASHPLPAAGSADCAPKRAKLDCMPPLPRPLQCAAR